MKKSRKGFTLVELLIVIGIIGILGAMGMMGGTEANNIATASKIIEEFRIIGAAMNMYYADNRSEVENAVNAPTLANNIAKGIAAYMKTTDAITTTTGTVGKYCISVNGTTKQWWLSYKLPQADSKVAQILANKAANEGLKATAAESVTDDTSSETTPNTYVATGKTVYMRVR